MACLITTLSRLTTEMTVPKWGTRATTQFPIIGSSRLRGAPRINGMRVTRRAMPARYIMKACTNWNATAQKMALHTLKTCRQCLRCGSGFMKSHCQQLAGLALSATLLLSSSCSPGKVPCALNVQGLPKYCVHVRRM